MAEIAQDHTDLLNDVATTATAPGRAAFWWLGQHTFIVKAGGHVFYLDPWFADWESRQTRSLLKAEMDHPADFALVTHGHADHLFGLDDLRIFGFYLKRAIPLYCEVDVERRIAKETRDALAAMGHTVGEWPEWEWRAGSVCGVKMGPEGTRWGGADPRRGSLAIAR